jgi:FlaA1/EpsC-like NDP-sugar epimerase
LLTDKRILVTGVCGTVGGELVRQLLGDHRVKEFIGLDNNESELFFLEQKYSKYPNTSFFLADVRDRDKLCRMMSGIDVVFHTAAFKHVDLCERSPFEAIQTNIIGVQNIIYAAIDQKVERVLFTSSDKAVNPTSVMGTSKLMGERLITAANSNLRSKGPVMSSTRFGNVLGSRGSVIPVFREQIRRGGPVTLTDPAMTRFIMSIEEAVQLILDSSFLSHGGEVFITKMPVIRIQDLADVMIQYLAPVYGHRPGDIDIKTVGPRPGEKIYEELMNLEETRRSYELEKYYVILPALSSSYNDVGYEYPGLRSKEVARPYHSGNASPMSKDQIYAYLGKNGMIEKEPDEKTNFT